MKKTIENKKLVKMCLKKKAMYFHVPVQLVTELDSVGFVDLSSESRLQEGDCRISVHGEGKFRGQTHVRGFLA